MPMNEIQNKKEEKPKIRCKKCGNKECFLASTKTKTIDCGICLDPIMKADENIELYKKLGGK